MILQSVIIIGGGPIGCLLAIALAPHFKITLVDAASPVPEYLPDGRGFALSPTSRAALIALGLWEEMAPHAHPIYDIFTLQEGDTAFVQYAGERTMQRALGYIVESHIFKTVLKKAAQACPNVRWQAPLSLKSLHRGDAFAEVTLNDGSVEKGALCIGADGRFSKVRELAGIESFGWPYHQTAFVGSVHHTYPHNGHAMEMFLKTGALALLPLKENESSLVWSASASLAAELSGYSPAAFAATLEKYVAPYYGKIQLKGTLHQYPLHMAFAHELIRPRVAIVGDAAHAIHPLAGQGLNLGIRDVAALAECLIKAARLGLDGGHMTVLKPYQQWRRFDNLSVLGLVEGLNRLFSNSSYVLFTLRRLGLNWLNKREGIKNYLIRQAAGEGGELPALLKGEMP